MKSKWIIEDFNDDQFTKELVQAVKDSGREVDITSYIPFRGGKYPQFDPNDCCVFHGSIQMALQLREEKNPDWVFMTPENYLCSKYYPKVEEFLLNKDYFITTAYRLKIDKWRIYQIYAEDACIFVRPDNGIKSFTGQLIDLQDFDRVWGGTDHIHFNVKDEDVVIVSSPKNIQGEWRFICSNLGEIIACSTYIYQSKKTYIPSAPTGATELCKEILKNGYYPDVVFSIDICQGTDGKFYFLEYNAFSSCGLYASNKETIVKKVSELVEYKFNVCK